MNRAFALLTVTGCIACSDPGVVDATKFTAVQAAAQSVRAEMHANGGGGSATCADRLRDSRLRLPPPAAT